MPPTGDLAHNPGMCPDWESNHRPFGSQPVLNPLSYTSQGTMLNLVQFQELMELHLLVRVSGANGHEEVGVQGCGTLQDLLAGIGKQSRICFLPRCFPVLPSMGLHQPGSAWYHAWQHTSSIRRGGVLGQPFSLSVVRTGMEKNQVGWGGRCAEQASQFPLV